MQKSKKIFIGCLTIILLSTIGVLAKGNISRSKIPDEGPIIIRLTHVAAEDAPIHLQSVKFKELIEERSNGKFEVQIFPNGQLGGDRQSVEALTLGTINATLPPTAIMAGFNEKMMVTDLPFVFKDREAVFKALDGELGEELNEYLLDLGIVNLGWGETGYRHITSNKGPIEKPEDLKGLKIRTMENTIHMAAFRNFGANPTPMNFSELFTALQQGTIDAEENPLQIIYANRLFEVQDYLTVSGHFFSSSCFVFGKEFYDSLPDDLRLILEESAYEAALYGRETIKEMEDDYLKQLEKEGMKINYLSDEQKEVFVEASQAVYEQFKDMLGQDLIDKATMYNS